MNSGAWGWTTRHWPTGSRSKAHEHSTRHGTTCSIASQRKAKPSKALRPPERDGAHAASRCARDDHCAGEPTMGHAQMRPSALTQRPAWKALKVHYETMRHRHLRQLFAEDPLRGERLTAEAAGLYLDYSKNRITDETLRLLLDLAEQCGARARIEAM